MGKELSFKEGGYSVLSKVVPCIFTPRKEKGRIFMDKNYQAQQTEQTIKVNKRSNVRPLFSTRMIAGIAIFTALAYGVSFLEFALFPASAVAFLKLDFSNVFIMLAGFMYGPIAALFVGVIKELLCLIGSSTFGVGQIANMAVILVYVLPPSIVYMFKRGIKVVIISLAVSCIVQTVVALLVNKFITFPLYGMAQAFDGVMWLLVAFNVIKSVSVSILTVLLYKRIGFVFEKIKIK